MINNREKEISTKYAFVSVEDKTFVKGQEVSLDNHRFLNCTFDGCELVWAGGPVVMQSCHWGQADLNIQGAMGILVQSLEGLGFTIVPPPWLQKPTVN